MSEKDLPLQESLPEDQEANQEVLHDILTICQEKLSRDTSDNIAYLRTPDTTISIHDYHKKADGKSASNELGNRPFEGVIGDYEVWTLEWLDKNHIGYGPHNLTMYKFFLYPDKIKVKRIFSVEPSNGDPREDAIIPPEVSRVNYLEDEDSEFAKIKESFEGIPKYQDPGSTEQATEELKRFFGGNPEDEELGLQKLTQLEAENLRKLLMSASYTHDPYFEE